MAVGVRRLTDTAPSSSNPKTAKRNGRRRLWAHFHLIHRILILATSVWVTIVCIESAIATVHLLTGTNPSPPAPTDSSSNVILSHLGSSTLDKSPLVTKTLQGQSSPINGTLYLDAQGASLTVCASVLAMQHAIYTDAFQRSIFAAVAGQLAYNLTFLSDLELVVPVVDCTMKFLQMDLPFVSKSSFLVRSVQSPSSLSIVTIGLSNQFYEIVDQGESGPAGVATITVISDLRATSVDHHFAISLGYPFSTFDFRACEFKETTSDGVWSLVTIPPPAYVETAKSVLTASRSGFFYRAETEQSNINNRVWERSNDPSSVLGHWVWISTPVLRDSWAWVHFVQLFIVLSIVGDTTVLLVVAYRNLQRGKFWVGDAFVSISSTLFIRGLLTLLSWYMNAFWALEELSLHDARVIVGLESVTIFEAIMHADLMIVYVSLCSILGVLFRVRVDPLVSIVSFEIGFYARQSLVKYSTSAMADITARAWTQYIAGITVGNVDQAIISPMLLWSLCEITNRDTILILSMLAPIVSTLVLIIAYIALRKLYMYFYPEPLHIQGSRNTTGSEADEHLRALKRVLTIFELATGAQLENRYGMLSEYENCLFIKGMKFASADGIYSNGFVIANEKYLVQTRDVGSVLLMKLSRLRYTNVYVYELTGTTVQQTARLVYPQTLTFQDLSNLNISVLS